MTSLSENPTELQDALLKAVSMCKSDAEALQMQEFLTAACIKETHSESDGEISRQLVSMCRAMTQIFLDHDRCIVGFQDSLYNVTSKVDSYEATRSVNTLMSAFITLARISIDGSQVEKRISYAATLYAYQVSSFLSQEELDPDIHLEILELLAISFTHHSIQKCLFEKCGCIILTIHRATFEQVMSPVLIGHLESISTTRKAIECLQLYTTFIAIVRNCKKGYVFGNVLDENSFLTIVIDTCLALMIELKNEAELATITVSTIISTIIMTRPDALNIIIGAIVDALNIDGSIFQNPENCGKYLQRITTILYKVGIQSLDVFQLHKEEQLITNEEEIRKLCEDIVDILHMMENEKVQKIWQELVVLFGGNFVRPLEGEVVSECSSGSKPEKSVDSAVLIASTQKSVIENQSDYSDIDHTMKMINNEDTESKVDKDKMSFNAFDFDDEDSLLPFSQVIPRGKSPTPSHSSSDSETRPQTNYDAFHFQDDFTDEDSEDSDSDAEAESMRSSDDKTYADSESKLSSFITKIKEENTQKTTHQNNHTTLEQESEELLKSDQRSETSRISSRGISANHGSELGTSYLRTSRSPSPTIIPQVAHQNTEFNAFDDNKEDMKMENHDELSRSENSPSSFGRKYCYELNSDINLGDQNLGTESNKFQEMNEHSKQVPQLQSATLPKHPLPHDKEDDYSCISEMTQEVLLSKSLADGSFRGDRVDKSKFYISELPFNKVARDIDSVLENCREKLAVDSIIEKRNTRRNFRSPDELSEFNAKIRASIIAGKTHWFNGLESGISNMIASKTFDENVSIFDLFLEIPHPLYEYSGKIKVVSPLDLCHPDAKTLLNEANLARIVMFTFPEVDFRKIHHEQSSQHPFDSDSSFTCFSILLGNGKRIYLHALRYLSRNVERNTQEEKALVAVTRATDSELIVRNLLKTIQAMYESGATQEETILKFLGTIYKKNCYFRHMGDETIRTNKYISVPTSFKIIDMQGTDFNYIGASFRLPISAQPGYDPKNLHLEREFSNFPIMPLLRCLGPKKMIRVLSALLCEIRVIFVSDCASKLSSCVHASLSVLSQGLLIWRHVCIPILTPHLLSPLYNLKTPFFIGVLEKQFDQVDMRRLGEVLRINLDTAHMKTFNMREPEKTVPNLIASIRHQTTSTDYVGVKSMYKDFSNLMVDDQRIWAASKPHLTKSYTESVDLSSEESIRRSLTSFFLEIYGNIKTYSLETICKDSYNVSHKIDKKQYLRLKLETGVAMNSPIWLVLKKLVRSIMFARFVNTFFEQVEKVKQTSLLREQIPPIILCNMHLCEKKSIFSTSEVRSVTKEVFTKDPEHEYFERMKAFQSDALNLTNERAYDDNETFENIRSFVINECFDYSFFRQALGLAWVRLGEDNPNCWKHIEGGLALLLSLMRYGPMPAVYEVGEKLNEIKALRCYQSQDEEAQSTVRQAANEVLILYRNIEAQFH